ncbi:sulfite exporter TauE/SafE family protein [Desulfotomaculum sp. 1211_IL3151]|uniref:sulfite exporter TauE/SafE family protein n=1 Tax=Desulfotomaculum sp. 1211_IL3151 TaxID=3084055 RepID=UPI002FDB7191
MISAMVIVFFASILQAAIGFGFAIMATPFLLLIFNSRDCVQISIILSFIVSLLLIFKIIKDVDKEFLKRLIWGSFVGAPIGVVFYSYVSLPILKFTVGIVIIFIAAFITLRAAIKKSSQSKKEEAIEESISSKIQFLIGLCGGMLTTSIGMPGVPLLLYFNLTNMKKETARSTTLTFFIFVYVISMVMQILTVGIEPAAITVSLKLIPIVAVGVFIGNLLFDKINQRTFQFAANGILIFTGIYMLFNSL